MASRLYFPSTGTPDITPAFGTGWNRTTGATRHNLVSAKIGSAKAEHTMLSTATSPEFHLSRQYVGPSLTAQTISGTCSGVIKGWMNNALFVGTVALCVRVVNSTGVHQAFLTNGATATPVASATGTTPPLLTVAGTTGHRRVFLNAADTSTVPLTSFACALNDRLVVEVGVRDADTGTSRSGTVRVGDDAGTDLPFSDNATTVGDEDPWIEFTYDFVLVGGGGAAVNGSLYRALYTYRDT